MSDIFQPAEQPVRDTQNGDAQSKTDVAMSNLVWMVTGLLMLSTPGILFVFYRWVIDGGGLL